MKSPKVYTHDIEANPGYKAYAELTPGDKVRLLVYKGENLTEDKTWKVGDRVKYDLGELLPGIITKISPRSVTVQSSNDAFFVYQVTIRKFIYVNL